MVSHSRLESAWTLIGTCAQIAKSLGMNRLGAELPESATYEQVCKRFGRRWANARDREDARRTFYHLVS